MIYSYKIYDIFLEDNEKICGPILLKGNADLIDCEHRSFHLMARRSY